MCEINFCSGLNNRNLGGPWEVCRDIQHVLVASFSLRTAVPSPASVLPWRGEGMATHRLRFFRKGLKETYSDKLSQLSWKIFHFALKSFFLNFCNWTELVFRLFVDTGSLDQLFRYLFSFFSLDNPLSRKEERPETKQFFGMELH